MRQPFEKCGKVCHPLKAGILLQSSVLPAESMVALTPTLIKCSKIHVYILLVEDTGRLVGDKMKFSLLYNMCRIVARGQIGA